MVLANAAHVKNVPAGLKVWDEFVTNVNGNDVPPIDPMRRASLERAVELRGQLISFCT